MAELERLQEDGLRFYQVTEDGKVIAKLPSVTTVLGQTKDMSGLAKWRKRVGEAEADRISNLSMSRGTIMHRLIELYKTETDIKTDSIKAPLCVLNKNLLVNSEVDLVARTKVKG